MKRIFANNADIMYLATSFIQIDEFGNEQSIKLKNKHANNNLIRRKINKHSLNKMSFYDVSIYNLAPGCCCAFRNSLLDEYLRTKDGLPHDWKLAIIASLKNGLFYLDIPTTKYRIYSNNTIGLGHIDTFKRRKKIVELNTCEKKWVANLVETICGNNSDEYRYAIKIFKLFQKRELVFQKNGIFHGLIVFIESLFIKGRLWESVAMDIKTAIKKN